MELIGVISPPSIFQAAKDLQDQIDKTQTWLYSQANTTQNSAVYQANQTTNTMLVTQLNNQQYQFLQWVNRNYEWLTHRGYKTTYQPFQHHIQRIMNEGLYTKEDKKMMDGVRRFLKGLGIKTYHRDWLWEKDGAELDWMCNLPIWRALRPLVQANS